MKSKPSPPLPEPLLTGSGPRPQRGPSALVRLACWAAALAAAFSLSAQTAGHGVSAAYLSVVQHSPSNTTDAITVSAPLAINDFRVRGNSNRGDYNVQIGDGFSDDVDTGILITCVAENGRDNAETNYPGLNFCTSTVDYSRTGADAGAYYISTFNIPSGAEYNINVAAAFFPYAQWLGGLARNSGATNAGANDLLSASPGLVLGTHFIDAGGGRSTINLTSFGYDSRSNGVLLVTHGKNEDNYALSQVNSNNGTWTVYVKDNGTDAGSYEQDPVAFVFIPRTNTTLISGRFRGDGSPLLYSGASPAFAITNTGTGTWRLTIPGHSPASGVLILSPEGGLSQNQDNVVSYRPDGSGWVIESRDLPGSPPSLQTPGNGLEPVAAFAFIPAAATATLLAPADGAQNLPNSPPCKQSYRIAPPATSPSNSMAASPRPTPPAISKSSPCPTPSSTSPASTAACRKCSTPRPNGSSPTASPATSPTSPNWAISPRTATSKAPA
jgi:hypothetical protein